MKNKIIISESQLKNIIKTINEQSSGGWDFKKGTGGDPYDYARNVDKYYYKKRGDKDWIEAKKEPGLSTIKKLFIYKKGEERKPEETKPEDKKFGDGLSLFGGREPLGENGMYIIPFAFPDYQPKIDGNGSFDKFIAFVSRKFSSGDEGTYGKVGHAGVATIEPNGNVRLFEFGRYNPKAAKQGYGVLVSKNLGNVAKLSKGKLMNSENLVKFIKSKTAGEGPRLTMDARVVPVPDINSAIQYAQSVKKKKYSALDYSISDDDASCSTYVQEVAKASKLDMPWRCYPKPTAMVTSFNDVSVKSITA